MGLKPDHWIRKMALEHRMIEPFANSQVRNGVISYGVSSYGYDIRVADEFKIFTNVFSAVVDPKQFDPRSMVDFKGEICIIPPNSFALARTIEYFRIPRKVLTVCLGKSTYARCFRGDTRVALVDGSSPTLEEMARRSEDGELFWGYSIGPNGRLIVTLLDDPRYIGRDQLLEVILDSGESIYCTCDHEFLTRDGKMVEADRLRPGNALMSLYRSIVRGYEMVYQPINGQLVPTHRLADEWNLRNEISGNASEIHRYHVDGDRGEYRPWNMTTMDAKERIRLPFEEIYGPDIDPLEHSTAIQEALGRLAEDPVRVKQYSRNQQGRALHFGHNEKYAMMCADRGAARLLNNDRTVFRRFPDVHNSFRGNRHVNYHRIAAIRALPGDHDTYCLTVPETGNFALEAGVFVHNCGIIVNVTPFEPEWEGFVTLEISNTTPLPARIYANEGIAQVLFFEADEECETSYADKKGKYQGQQSIVLPKL